MDALQLHKQQLENNVLCDWYLMITDASVCKYDFAMFHILIKLIISAQMQLMIRLQLYFYKWTSVSVIYVLFFLK